MSKTSPQDKAGTKASHHRGSVGKVSPRVQEMVAGLHELCDAIEAGASLEQVATVRTYRIDLTLPELSPDDIRSIREGLGLSQCFLPSSSASDFPPSGRGNRASACLRRWPGDSWARSGIIQSTGGRNWHARR